MKDSCFMVKQELDSRFMPVFPICERDLQMMIKSLEWMHELDGQQDEEVLLSIDDGTNKILVGEVEQAAKRAFSKVLKFAYERSPIPNWPHGPNWAFQNTADFMCGAINRPWLWMEADCVPLKSGWLSILQMEYERFGKPLMGNIVDGRGHVNGTAIYPANLADISPKAMNATHIAWDWEMKDDVIHLTHNVPHLMQHCWGIERGLPHPYNGNPASFPTQLEVDAWIIPTAVVFHRSKHGDLIDRLRERKLIRKAA